MGMQQYPINQAPGGREGGRERHNVHVGYYGICILGCSGNWCRLSLTLQTSQLNL